MPDNKNITGPQDASRINIHEVYEVAYWTHKFGCTTEELKAAVNQVGVSASAVEQALNTR